MVPLKPYKWENFSPYLMLRLTDLDQEAISCQVRNDQEQAIQIEGCSLSLNSNVRQNFVQPAATQSEIEARIKDAFCDAISDFFVEELEEEYIKSIISESYGFTHPDQIEGIYHYCFDHLFLLEDTPYRDEIKIKQRKNQVYAKVLECIEEEKLFHLDGFIRFRLTDYRLELEELIEYAIDEYIVEQEYQEFIQILRAYVSRQLPKTPVIHAYHVLERKFILFNEAGEQLTKQELEQYLNTWALDGASQEELIVSTLIAMAPKTIILHTFDVNLAVVKTLKTIFQDRLYVCLNCEKCRQWHRESFMLPK